MITAAEAGKRNSWTASRLDDIEVLIKNAGAQDRNEVNYVVYHGGTTTGDALIDRLVRELQEFGYTVSIVNDYGFRNQVTVSITWPMAPERFVKLGS